MKKLDELPVELLASIVAFFQGDRATMSTIAKVNKLLNELAHWDKWGYKLFKEHYQKHSSSFFPTLKKQSLTSRHIRKGNELVETAMDLLTEGQFTNAMPLIRQAMYIHRSSRAIRLYEMLGKIGCCLKKNPDLDLKKQIAKARKSELQIIYKELEKEFEKNDLKYCWEDINAVFEHQDYHLTCFIENFPSFYIRKKIDPLAVPECSLINKHTNVISIVESISKCLMSGTKHKIVDANAYLGFDKPIKKSWFLEADTKEEQDFNKISQYLR